MPTVPHAEGVFHPSAIGRATVIHRPERHPVPGTDGARYIGDPAIITRYPTPADAWAAVPAHLTWETRVTGYHVAEDGHDSWILIEHPDTPLGNTKTCVACGEDFDATNNAVRTCSEKCRIDQRNTRERARHAKKTAETFPTPNRPADRRPGTKPSGGPGRGNHAASRWKTKACVMCSTPFRPSGPNSKACSDDCKARLHIQTADRAAATRRARLALEVPKPPKPRAPKVYSPKPCDVCGTTFTPNGPAAKGCSQPCRDVLAAKRSKRADNIRSLRRRGIHPSLPLALKGSTPR